MKRIMGIWDLARSGGSLGRLIVLLEELEIQRQVHDADVVDVVIVSDASHLIERAPNAQVDLCAGSGSSKVGSLQPVVAVIRAISGVADCYVCLDEQTIHDAKHLMRTHCVLWPDPDALVQGRHNYDSTRVIQDCFARRGNIPRLRVNVELLAWAGRYLEEKAQGKRSVAVHLKNNPNISGQSNANMGAWLEFFRFCHQEARVHFVLVGDEPVSTEYRSLPNVTIAQDDRITVHGYLALIEAATVFMGMMSGPANMALFGKNPYLIFKNPDHHAREMAVELGDRDRYPFALEHQRVLRVWDTKESLIGAFQNMLAQVIV